MVATRITGQKPTECSKCSGLGYTRETADLMETRRPTAQEVLDYGMDPREWVECATVRKGSGCPRCKGVGQILHS